MFVLMPSLSIYLGQPMFSGTSEGKGGIEIEEQPWITVDLASADLTHHESQLPFKYPKKEINA